MGQSQSRRKERLKLIRNLGALSWDDLTEHREYDTPHLEGTDVSNRRVLVRQATRTTQCDRCNEHIENSDLFHHIAMQCQREGSSRLRDEGTHMSGSKNHRCNTCAISSPNNKALRFHIFSNVCASDSDERPTNGPVARPSRDRFICEACHEDFSTADDLQWHESISFGGRERNREDLPAFFHCEQCDAYFNFEQDFLVHFQGCDIPVASQPQVITDKTSPPSYPPEDTKSSCQSGEGRAFECPVCMEDQSHLSSVPCGHLFCTSCIRAALKADRRCPVCRSLAQEADLRRIFFYGSG